MRFFGLDQSDTVSVANTIWLFKKRLAKAGQGKPLVNLFERRVVEEYLIIHTGTTVGEMFVEVSR